ncbi:hypothetical protein Nepgr_011895 [Nepenthes gracilis]|uniref:Uncharacterized protein n=1 Tax=Nepenthes gracilis TaxID=150966 RepID=A0AAD3SG43_NEPGR|nr:hypothetical protein Nepgr_011895 [Nepenthes gracilis]
MVLAKTVYFTGPSKDPLLRSMRLLGEVPSKRCSRDQHLRLAVPWGIDASSFIPSHDMPLKCCGISHCITGNWGFGLHMPQANMVSWSHSHGNPIL